MGSISSALSNATSGLRATQRRADLVSNNIANALTPGYTRRDIVVNERGVQGGGGVSVDGVRRAEDAVLTRERRGAEGVVAREQIIADTQNSFNTSLGEPEDPFSFFTQYSNIESSLRALATTPESIPLQDQVLQSAKTLTRSFNDLSTKAQDARLNADQEIARTVNATNEALEEIVELNNEISALEVGGQDASALKDQRKRLIDQVSEAIPVREIKRDFGRVDLMTDEGVFLIAGSAQKIEFNPAFSLDPSVDFATGGLSGLSVDGTDITPGASSQGPQQGSLAGHFMVRDEIAPDFQTKIDALARDLIERFEGIDTTLPAGAPGLFTDAGAAFDPANEVGLASRIAVNTAVDPSQGGDTTLLRDGLGATTAGPSGDATFIRAMLDSFTALRTPPVGSEVSGQQNAVGLAASFTSRIGSATVIANNTLTTSSARATGLSDAELAITAVDTDAELQKLLQIEQAYAANARVIQTAEQMLQTLIDL